MKRQPHLSTKHKVYRDPIIRKLLNRMSQVMGINQQDYQRLYLPCIEQFDQWLLKNDQAESRQLLIPRLLKKMIKALSLQRACVLPVDDSIDRHANPTSLWQYAIFTAVLIREPGVHSITMLDDQQADHQKMIVPLVSKLLPAQGRELLQTDEGLYQQWLSVCAGQENEEPLACLVVGELPTSASLSARLVAEKCAAKKLLQAPSLCDQFLAWLKRAIAEGSLSVNQPCSCLYHIEAGMFILLNQTTALFLSHQHHQMVDKVTFFSMRKKLMRQLKHVPDIQKRDGGSIVWSYYRGDDQQKIKLSGIILPAQHCFTAEKAVPILSKQISQSIIQP